MPAKYLDMYIDTPGYLTIRFRCILVFIAQVLKFFNHDFSEGTGIIPNCPTSIQAPRLTLSSSELAGSIGGI